MAKVFIIESGTDAVKKIITELNSKGHESKLLRSCATAANQIAKERPDLVLLDLILDGRDGLDVLKTLKKDSKTKDIPVVIFTDMSEEIGYSMAMNEGAYDYIKKTYRDSSQCAMMISAILDETAAR